MVMSQDFESPEEPDLPEREDPDDVDEECASAGMCPVCNMPLDEISGQCPGCGKGNQPEPEDEGSPMLAANDEHAVRARYGDEYAAALMRCASPEGLQTFLASDRFRQQFNDDQEGFEDISDVSELARKACEGEPEALEALGDSFGLEVVIRTFRTE